MIDIVNPDEEFSVAQFKTLAEESIRDILSRKKVPIVAGGTGLYINSLVYNIQFSDTISDWEFRERMNALAVKYGPGYLHDRLKEVDPVSAQRIHPNNIKRVIRALEVFETTGKPISSIRLNPGLNRLNLITCSLALPWIGRSCMRESKNGPIS